MPKTATKLKTGANATWHPDCCEGCNHPFNHAWESDYSISGELIWICPQCQHTNYPPIDERDEP